VRCQDVGRELVQPAHDCWRQQQQVELNFAVADIHRAVVRGVPAQELHQPAMDGAIQVLPQHRELW
jgi:hypothetical protein